MLVLSGVVGELIVIIVGSDVLFGSARITNLQQIIVKDSKGNGKRKKPSSHCNTYRQSSVSESYLVSLGD